ncbi:MAG TPA: hypothetical protein VGP77_00260 [Vicinamibacterales bacterium]|nr:hypothetical protein [Vicinamibacterales bacterium]
MIEHSAPTGAPATDAIDVGVPVLLETHTASVRAGNFVRRAALPVGMTLAVEADAMNNLLVGVVAQARLRPGAVGLAQVYGPAVAAVYRDASPLSAGVLLQPSPGGFVATFAVGSVKPSPGVGGLAILLEDIAAGPTTETVAACVWLRCM